MILLIIGILYTLMMHFLIKSDIYEKSRRNNNNYVYDNIAYLYYIIPGIVMIVIAIFQIFN